MNDLWMTYPDGGGVLMHDLWMTYPDGGVFVDVAATGQHVGQLGRNEGGVDVVVHRVSAGNVHLGNVHLPVQLDPPLEQSTVTP